MIFNKWEAMYPRFWYCAERMWRKTEIFVASHKGLLYKTLNAGYPLTQVYTSYKQMASCLVHLRSLTMAQYKNVTQIQIRYSSRWQPVVSLWQTVANTQNKYHTNAIMQLEYKNVTQTQKSNTNTDPHTSRLHPVMSLSVYQQQWQTRNCCIYALYQLPKWSAPVIQGCLEPPTDWSGCFVFFLEDHVLASLAQ